MKLKDATRLAVNCPQKSANYPLMQMKRGVFVMIVMTIENVKERHR